jgi:hypothetical protein
MSEATLSSAINTATAVVGAPVHWLDLIVTSLMSGLVALGVGVLTALLFWLIARWRPVGVASFTRWVIAAGTGAVAGGLFVASSAPKFGAASWPYWLSAICILLAALLLLLFGLLGAGVRSLWRLGRKAAGKEGVPQQKDGVVAPQSEIDRL